MGSIAVVLSRVGPPDPELPRRMLAAAPHRGERRSVCVLGRVALGASFHADWPTGGVAERSGRLAAFAGNLDNGPELEAELRRAGVPGPDGPGAAALFLAALDRWGDAAVGRLRGSFAGAYTDGRTVHCFRDHFGGRPLFQHDGPDGYFAATEVKQVLAGAPVRREPDLDHLHGVLFGGLDVSTAFKGVQRVPKWSVVAAGPEPGTETRGFWDPTEHVETSNLGPKAAVEGTVAALERAVHRVLSGRDVILLSGGLDSPALAVFAAGDPAGSGGAVQALTATYPEHPSVDELEWTRKVADHLSMPLHRYVAEAASLDDVDGWMALLDGPVDILSIPESAEAYRHARELGGRTVINGEIAEMLFECRGFLLDHLLSHGRLGPALRTLGEFRSKGLSRAKLAKRVIQALTPGRAWTLYRRLRPLAYRGVPDWVDSSRFTTAGDEPPLWSLSPRSRWRAMQTAPFMGPGIGFEADDICAAVCGVDSRRPFTDVDLWEFVLGLPAEVKFSGPRTKPLLRDAMRGLLPDEIIDRRDKTLFDEFHMATADYPTLRRLLSEPRHRLEGIDYETLAERLSREDLRIYELRWARDVARVHAFLNQW